MNGDLLTDLPSARLVALHRRAGNVVTIATHERSTSPTTASPLEPGESPRLVRYEEKPETSLTVSMGIYVMEPEVLRHIPNERYFDFPELVQRLLEDGQQVGTFPFTGFWLDIGRRDDYEQAMHAGTPSTEGRPPRARDALARLSTRRT